MKIKLTRNFKIFITILFFVFGSIFLSRFISYFRENIRLFEPPEDPRVTQIKKDVILPFCETKGNITEENIGNFFSERFITKYETTEVTNWDTMERHTPITAAKEKYDFMFVDYMDIKNCETYLKKMRVTEYEKFQPNLPEDIDFADFRFTYYPTKDVRLSLTLKNDSGQLMINSVGSSVTFKINPFD